MANRATSPVRRPAQAAMQTLVNVLAPAALVALCLEHGFERPPAPTVWLWGVQAAAIAAHLIRVAGQTMLSPSPVAAVYRFWPDLLLTVTGGLLLIGEHAVLHGAQGRSGAVELHTIQVIMVGRVVIGMARWYLRLIEKQLHPARLLVFSFFSLIMIGGSLLALPMARIPEKRAETRHYLTLGILDCYFTATSAVCVTGLTVYDTGHDFTRFGQVVIICLIQVGGLGIMILGGLLGLLIGEQLSLRQSLALQDALSDQTIGQLRSMVRFVVVSTFAIELVGAALLYPMFAPNVPALGDRIFWCVFHAVSAFCNAGFALPTDNLMSYSRCAGVYISIMPLIVLGGLGFPVLHDLWGWLRSRISRLRRLGPGGPAEGAPWRPARPGYRLRLHAKLVLVTSAILIIVPSVLMFSFESVEWRTPEQAAESKAIGHAMIDLPPWERAGAALFQSVTARTAGYNTAALDVSSMSTASHFLLVLLMFIGGSPASTAGGIKTVTAAVLVLGVVNTLRGRERVEVFGRTLPQVVLQRAAVVAIVMSTAVCVTVLTLCFTESRMLVQIMFEAASAFGTVGLSTGITPQLTPVGRVLIMLAMFAGRVGPLTLLIALAGRRTTARYEYPREEVIIG